MDIWGEKITRIPANLGRSLLPQLPPHPHTLSVPLLPPPLLARLKRPTKDKSRQITAATASRYSQPPLDDPDHACNIILIFPQNHQHLPLVGRANFLQVHSIYSLARVFDSFPSNIPIALVHCCAGGPLLEHIWPSFPPTQ